MFPGIYLEGCGRGCGTIGIAMYLFGGDFSWEKLLLGGGSWQWLCGNLLEVGLLRERSSVCG